MRKQYLLLLWQGFALAKVGGGGQCRLWSGASGVNEHNGPCRLSPCPRHPFSYSESPTAHGHGARVCALVCVGTGSRPSVTWSHSPPPSPPPPLAQPPEGKERGVERERQAKEGEAGHRAVRGRWATRPTEEEGPREGQGVEVGGSAPPACRPRHTKGVVPHPPLLLLLLRIRVSGEWTPWGWHAAAVGRPPCSFPLPRTSTGLAPAPLAHGRRTEDWRCAASGGVPFEAAPGPRWTRLRGGVIRGTQRSVHKEHRGYGHDGVRRTSEADLPLPSASSDMIRWSRVLLSRWTQHVPTEFWWCRRRVLLSGLRYGADSCRKPVSLADASGMSLRKSPPDYVTESGPDPGSGMRL